MSPRDAFFAETEQVRDPIGHISAEMISPYPPGVPAILPGERFNEAVVTYLRAGKAAHRARLAAVQRRGRRTG
jgi:arginine/lysine/ornithine decarboxylase